MKDIFDLNDLSDVSDEVRKAIKPASSNDKIIELFQIAKRELKTSELIVAYYRKFGVALTKKQMYMRLWVLLRNKSVEQVRRGLYRLKVKVE